ALRPATPSPDRLPPFSTTTPLLPVPSPLRFPRFPSSSSPPSPSLASPPPLVHSLMQKPRPHLHPPGLLPSLPALCASFSVLSLIPPALADSLPLPRSPRPCRSVPALRAPRRVLPRPPFSLPPTLFTPPSSPSPSPAACPAPRRAAAAANEDSL
ncbi:hypothetical protein DFH06DRAFT_1198710, partial [Mycena polygramma]